MPRDELDRRCGNCGYDYHPRFDVCVNLECPRGRRQELTKLNPTKPTNPKDIAAIRRVPSSVRSALVDQEVSVGLWEGAFKYRRHNYRVAGVLASVYFDAAKRHLDYWWEGEDLDPDTGLSHVTKAIACLYVLRDAMIMDKFKDDRPPKHNLEAHKKYIQERIDDVFSRFPNGSREPWTELNKGENATDES